MVDYANIYNETYLSSGLHVFRHHHCHKLEPDGTAPLFHSMYLPATAQLSKHDLLPKRSGWEALMDTLFSQSPNPPTLG